MASKEAKEYVDTVMPVEVKYTDYVSCEYTEEQLQEAFDAGVESERQRHRWHNLEENPEDLPDWNKTILINKKK